MEKQVNINGEITPDTLLEFTSKVAENEAESELSIFIDSEGGCIASALLIAAEIDKLKKKGIKITTVADGKVYSSAVVIYLAGDVKIFNLLKSPKILVHKVSVILEQDLDLHNIDEQYSQTKEELVQFSQELREYYAKKGVSPEVIEKLTGDSDFIVDNFEAAKNYGLADASVGKINMFREYVNLLKHTKKPLYKTSTTYLNYKNLKMDTTATSNPVAMNAAEAAELREKVNGMHDMMNSVLEKLENLGKSKNVDFTPTENSVENTDFEEIEEEFDENNCRNFLKNFKIVKNRKNGATNVKIVSKCGNVALNSDEKFEKFEVEKAVKTVPQQEHSKNAEMPEISYEAPKNNASYVNKGVPKKSQAQELHEYLKKTGYYSKFQ